MRQTRLIPALLTALLFQAFAQLARAEPASPADDDWDAEEAAILSKPPAAGKGAIVGVVTDTQLHESVIEAQVAIVGGSARTFTDLEGRFRLELPPGTYDVRLSYELYRPTRVAQVVVKAGEVTRIDVSLAPDESSVETVEIVSQVDQASVEGQTWERRRSAAVGDGVGRAEIARTPDRNAAEAARRVVGANVVGGRFVYVRGLGERYTNASLNGSPLPSPEPDRNTVPLDLFPALVIDSITISKTFTPDQPADFAGGSVKILTRKFPEQPLLQLSLNAGLNTATSFRQGLDYQGSSTDWLGFDGGLRQLPEQVPDEKLSRQDAERLGPQLSSRMSTRRRRVPPSHGGSLVLGDAWKLGAERKLGALLALSYGRSYQVIRDERLRVYRLPSAGSEELFPRVDYRAERGIEAVRWGAFASLSYEASPHHRFSVNGLHSQSADDTASEIEGFAESSGRSPVHLTRLSYASRALDFGQVKGEHELPALANARLDWFAALSHATRDEPDTRSNLYFRPLESAEPAWIWQAGAQSGSHFFAQQNELSRAGGVDWTQPLSRQPDAPKLKLGGAISSRERAFSARRFELGRGRSLSPAERALFSCSGVTFSSDCSDKLFRSSHVGTILTIDEKTRENDAYDAGLDVYAGYLLLDAEVLSGLRAVAGARLEATRQDIRSFNPFAPEEAIAGEIAQLDVLPALSLVYGVSKQANTRLAISKTLARPQLRELAPFVFNPYFGGLPTQGNPQLRLTRVTNADLRFEYFPTLREVLAFSFFYKRFEHPIEEVLRTRGEAYVTYDNAPSADLFGVELEARQNLERLTPALKHLTALANLTWVESRVKLDTLGINTNASRPLSNQAPYVVNLALDYSRPETRTQARISYNVSGARLVMVGSEGLQDTYEQPRHLLDLTIAQGIGQHFELKANAQNLLDAQVKTTQKGPDPDGAGPRKAQEFITSELRLGTSFSLSASYTY